LQIVVKIHLVALLVLDNFLLRSYFFGETLLNSDLSLIYHTIGSPFHIMSPHAYSVWDFFHNCLNISDWIWMTQESSV